MPCWSLDPTQNLCGKPIKHIAKKLKIFPEVLWAVTATESSYRGAPWPWSANLNGKSYYFRTKQQLKNFVKKISKHSRQNLDLGCMQLNYRYHRWKFKSLNDMIDPHQNMIFGSLYLYELFLKEKIRLLQYRKEHPRWKMPSDYYIWAIVVGKYHSFKEKRGKKYVNSVAKYLSPQPQFHTPGIQYHINVNRRNNHLSSQRSKAHLNTLRSKAQEIIKSYHSFPIKKGHDTKESRIATSSPTSSATSVKLINN
ncbi:MAG TPA: hypothetical protein VNJ29_02810 [Candidatus Nitrosotenuis sp.]|nr:hypothetical protein [Candidatus Nitrosotenuis sp.]